MSDKKETVVEKPVEKLLKLEKASEQVSRVYRVQTNSHIGTLTLREEDATFMPVTYEFLTGSEMREILSYMEAKRS